MNDKVVHKTVEALEEELSEACLANDALTDQLRTQSADYSRLRDELSHLLSSAAGHFGFVPPRPVSTENTLRDAITTARHALHNTPAGTSSEKDDMR